MQTAFGPDTANLRYRNGTSDGMEIKVSEEQSKDLETQHAPCADPVCTIQGEGVGYLAIGYGSEN